MSYLTIALISMLIAIAHANCGRGAVGQCMDEVVHNPSSLAYREIQHLTRGGKPAATEESEDSEEGLDDVVVPDEVSYITIAVPTNLSISCGDFHTLNECIDSDEGMRMCEDITRSSYEGIKASYSYLCTPENKALYAKHSACLFGEELKNSEHLCEKKFENNPELMQLIQTELTFSIQNFDIKEEKKNCQKYKMMHELIACQEASVNNTCGQEAADLWKTYIDKKFVSFTAKEGCEEYYNDLEEEKEGILEWLPCDDGSGLYLETAKCDMTPNCVDKSDENNCTYTDDDKNEAYTELSTRNMVLLIVMGSAMLVLGIGAICMVKYKENRDFNAQTVKDMVTRRFRNDGKATGHTRMENDDMDEIMDDQDAI